jgi:hypothetical protein
MIVVAKINEPLTIQKYPLFARPNKLESAHS